MIKAIIYTLPTCMSCRYVKSQLEKLGVEITELCPVEHARHVDDLIRAHGLRREAPLVELIVDDEHHFFTGNRAGDLAAITYLAQGVA